MERSKPLQSATCCPQRAYATPARKEQASRGSQCCPAGGCLTRSPPELEHRIPRNRTSTRAVPTAERGLGVGTCQLLNERSRVAGAHERVVYLLAGPSVASLAQRDRSCGTTSTEEHGARTLDDFASCGEPGQLAARENAATKPLTHRRQPRPEQSRQQLPLRRAQRKLHRMLGSTGRPESALAKTPASAGRRRSRASADVADGMRLSLQTRLLRRQRIAKRQLVRTEEEASATTARATWRERLRELLMTFAASAGRS